MYIYNLEILLPLNHIFPQNIQCTLLNGLYMMGATSGEGTVYLPEHPSSLRVFSRVHVSRSLVLCVCFVDRCLSFCLSFGHCVVCPSLIYGF